MIVRYRVNEQFIDEVERVKRALCGARGHIGDQRPVGIFVRGFQRKVILRA